MSDRRTGIVSWVPFGLGHTKPNHFSAMARILWRNKDALPYAWKVLSQGTCDGCALGTIGMNDWTLGPKETHLCMVRLELLRLNTMGPISNFEARMKDPVALRKMGSTELRELGRIPYPMRWRRGEPGYERISWQTFFDELGAKIRATEDKTQLAFYLTSRGITNETYYVGQKVARFLGTNNVDNSARLCHAPSTTALKEGVGVGATTCSYRDWFESELILFLGSNPANDQPVSMKYLITAKEHGARIITINTYREPGMKDYWVPSNAKSALFGTPVTDDFVLVHTGGDLALLNAVQKRLIERGAINTSFIEAHTTGFEALKRHLELQDLEKLCLLAGVSRGELERLVDRIAAADRGVLVWSMGLTQHQHGADTVRAVVNLALLRGWVGRPGTGLMPIRGHSGVQGGSEMGAYATALPGGIPLTPDNAEALSQRYGFKINSQQGLTTPKMIDAAEAGQLAMFYIVGGNFLETLPQPDRVEWALANVPARVHQDIFLTTQMMVPPKEVAYVVPARTRYEQRDGGTETTTERRVVLSPPIPGHDIGEALSEWEILMRLAEVTDPPNAHKIHFSSGYEIRSEIGAVVPSYAPIAQLKPGEAFQWGGPRLCEGGQFPLPDGRAVFSAVKPPELSLELDQLRFSTRRGKQFNSMVQAERDPLTGADRGHVFMAPEDAERLALKEGDWVKLTSVHGDYRGKVKLAPMRPGNVQGHWPEVNSLLPMDRQDRASGVPDYNAVVKIERVSNP